MQKFYRNGRWLSMEQVNDLKKPKSNKVVEPKVVEPKVVEPKVVEPKVVEPKKKK